MSPELIGILSVGAAMLIGLAESSASTSRSTVAYGPTWLPSEVSSSLRLLWFEWTYGPWNPASPRLNRARRGSQARLRFSLPVWVAHSLAASANPPRSPPASQDTASHSASYVSGGSTWPVVFSRGTRRSPQSGAQVAR